MGGIEVTQKDGAEHGMSKRGFANVESIMPKINAQVAERMKTHNFNIDLSTAENCLIRPEVVEIYKKAINDGLSATVCLIKRNSSLSGQFAHCRSISLTPRVSPVPLPFSLSLPNLSTIIFIPLRQSRPSTS
jgi:hypothetical protein